MKQYKYNYLLLSAVVIVPGNAQFVATVAMNNIADFNAYKITCLTLSNATYQRGANVLPIDYVSIQITGVNMFQLPNPQFSSSQIYVSFQGGNQVHFNGLSIQADINFTALANLPAGFLAGDSIEIPILIEWEYEDSKQVS